MWLFHHSYQGSIGLFNIDGLDTRKRKQASARWETSHRPGRAIHRDGRADSTPFELSLNKPLHSGPIEQTPGQSPGLT